MTGGAFRVDRVDDLLKGSRHTGVANGSLTVIELSTHWEFHLRPGQECSRFTATRHWIRRRGGCTWLKQRCFPDISCILWHAFVEYAEFTTFILWTFPGAASERPIPSSVNRHLRLTDNEVTSELLKAVSRNRRRGHLHADRIVSRRHFKVAVGAIRQMQRSILKQERQQVVLCPRNLANGSSYTTDIHHQEVHQRSALNCMTKRSLPHSQSRKHLMAYLSLRLTVHSRKKQSTARPEGI